MQKLNQQPDICPYFSPEFKVIPQYIIMKEGECMELNNRTTSFFIFILSGEITISFEQYTNRSVLENEMFFLPKNNCFKWKAVTQTVLILTGYNATIFPCTSVRARILYKIKAGVKFDCRGVVMKDEVKVVVNQMKHYLESGINCHHMYILKHKELYLMFKHFYTYEEIIQIFYLILGSNPLFNERVLDNYLKVKTVKELAGLLGYGIKTFEKLFRENFDESPYKWMQKRKAL